MSIKMYAAVDVGSDELAMKIFEISARKGIHEVDFVRHRIELGRDTYATGKISYARVDELCRVLREFVQIMKAYGVTDYRAYGTSAIRETENTTIILDQIRIRTGIRIEVISNSEQRFLDYKSIAAKGEKFNHIIEKGSVIVDIGGGSIQISFFDKDSLVFTQNLRLGVLRLREEMNLIQPTRAQFQMIMEEIIVDQLQNFKKMYLKETEIKNVIIVDDYVTPVLRNPKIESSKEGEILITDYRQVIEKIRVKKMEQLVEFLDTTEENMFLFSISSTLIDILCKSIGAENIWAPGVTLCDGMAYEYAESKKLLPAAHDFEQDIIACAGNISKRYMGSKKRGETLEKISLEIFDSMKKIHGMGNRERLLLRIAALLHDCGKYISLSRVGESSYDIVMATEIIGLSHVEREIVANVVKYNHMEFNYYRALTKESPMERSTYLLIAKLTAILRVANALDKSHKQKCKDMKAALKEEYLQLTVAGGVDITLEKGLFAEKADFFEEVYSVRPVIKQRREK